MGTPLRILIKDRHRMQWRRFKYKEEKKMSDRGKKRFAIYAGVVLSLMLSTVMVYATEDPLTAVDNFSEFMFSLIRAVGLIVLGWGVVQVGMSMKSHDPSQRANGVLTLAGGLIIVFTKEILDLIVGG